MTTMIHRSMKLAVAACFFIPILSMAATTPHQSMTEKPPAPTAPPGKCVLMPGTEVAQPTGPYSRVYHPENLPDKEFGFPSTWTSAYFNPQHNAAYLTPPNDLSPPLWLTEGVTWNYQQARAWPLDKLPYATDVIGMNSAGSTQTQWMGNPLGATAVDGIIYAASGDTFTYAVNAETGKLIWRNSPVQSVSMASPLVADGKVFISFGTAAFNFSNVVNYSKDPSSAKRGQNVMYNGVMALDSKNGELQWYVLCEGEVMPTPVLIKGENSKPDMLYFPTGAGTAYAVHADTGKIEWGAYFNGGMANMSSPALGENGVIYFSMAAKSCPPDKLPLSTSPIWASENDNVEGCLYALDTNNKGAVLWANFIPHAANTGMGDVSPAYFFDEQENKGFVVMDSITQVPCEPDDKPCLNSTTTTNTTTNATTITSTITSTKTTINTAVVAYDAEDGSVIWCREMGAGTLPNSFKGGVPTIFKSDTPISIPHDGVQLSPSCMSATRSPTAKATTPEPTTTSNIVVVGSPVENKYLAYDLNTGAPLWTWTAPMLSTKQGEVSTGCTGRAPATYYNGTLYIAAGPSIYAIDPATGKTTGEKFIGGLFGLTSPTIVGGTIYITNSYDWIHAVPLSDIKPISH